MLKHHASQLRVLQPQPVQLLVILAKVGRHPLSCDRSGHGITTSYWASVRTGYLCGARARDAAVSSQTGPERRKRAKKLSMMPYFADSTLWCIAGLFNPIGMILVAISE